MQKSSLSFCFISKKKKEWNNNKNKLGKLSSSQLLIFNTRHNQVECGWTSKTKINIYATVSDKGRNNKNGEKARSFAHLQFVGWFVHHITKFKLMKLGVKCLRKSFSGREFSCICICVVESMRHISLRKPPVAI